MANVQNTLEKFNKALENAIKERYSASISTEAAISRSASAETMQIALKEKNNPHSTMSSTAIETLEKASNSEFRASEKLAEKANSPLNTGSALANTSTTLLKDWKKQTDMDDSKLILKVIRANARAFGGEDTLPSREDIAQNPEKFARDLAKSLIPDGNHGSVDKGIKMRFNGLMDKTLGDKEHSELPDRLSKSSKSGDSAPDLVAQAKSAYSMNAKMAEMGMEGILGAIAGLSQEKGASSLTEGNVQRPQQKGGRY